MDTATVRNESPGREFSELTAQARAAYQEKRIKECIDITHRVLLADPGNAEANARKLRMVLVGLDSIIQKQKLPFEIRRENGTIGLFDKGKK